jgi:hypothetical protein
MHPPCQNLRCSGSCGKQVTGSMLGNQEHVLGNQEQTICRGRNLRLDCSWDNHDDIMTANPSPMTGPRRSINVTLVLAIHIFTGTG